jgi:mRNA-degrading endonuclease RelE of RelBE toxin-antitoxin system
MSYSVVIDPLAIQDIQQAIEYCDEQQTGLGLKFEAALDKHLITLEKIPFFLVRYDNVRCLPLKKFPYMVHFTIDESKNIVIIRAVLHTSLSSRNWKKRVKS